MLMLIYELLPVLLFFIAFKFYGIYVATVVGIAVTALQVLIQLIAFRRIDKKQWITLAAFIVFGGLTLYFHNPIFIKWKPTIVFGIFSIVLLASQVWGAKPLMQRILEASLDGKATVTALVWTRINLAWAVFFLLLGGLNLYVAYTLTTEAWVNFKLYGVSGLLLLFSFLQAIYLARYPATNEK